EARYALTGIKESIFDSLGFIIRKDLFRPVAKRVKKQIGTYKRASKATGALAGDPRMAFVTEEGHGILPPDWDGVIIPTYSCDYIRMESFSPKPAFKEDMRRAARAAADDLHEVGTHMEYFISQHEVRRPDGTRELTKLSFEALLKG